MDGLKGKKGLADHFFDSRPNCLVEETGESKKGMTILGVAVLDDVLGLIVLAGVVAGIGSTAFPILGEPGLGSKILPIFFKALASGNIASQIQERMNLDGGLVPSELRPGKEGEARVDGCRIESIGGPI